MPTVALTLPHHRYDIQIGSGTLSRLGDETRRVAPHDRAALLVDEAIAPTHGDAARAALERAGYAVTVVPLPRGEGNKSLDTVRDAYDRLLDARLERRSPVVAVGGGIVGDTAGFVAATYLRGVPFVQVPTTLLAMVDSSVGGKVGVNVPQGKNLIGAFYQPNLVVADVETLRTLPPRELRCGLAECVKHGVIRDPALFEWIEANLPRIEALDADALVELVARNVAIKAAVVMADEKETGERAHLNFGHTFAHAIEAAMLPHDGTSEHGPYLHGEAVALGMVAATRLAIAQGSCDPSLAERLTALLGRIGLPTAARDLPAPERMLEWMRLDKKVEDARLRLVLPVKMGEVVVASDVPDAAIASAWASLMN